MILDEKLFEDKAVIKLNTEQKRILWDRLDMAEVYADEDYEWASLDRCIDLDWELRENGDPDYPYTLYMPGYGAWDDITIDLYNELITGEKVESIVSRKGLRKHKALKEDEGNQIAQDAIDSKNANFEADKETTREVRKELAKQGIATKEDGTPITEDLDSNLINELEDKLKDFESRGFEDLQIQVDGNYIWFLAELSYRTQAKLADELDVIVQKYDKDAYFDAEDAGRWFAVVNATTLTEANENKCCICGGPIGQYGNNAQPVKDGVCCDKCNYEVVLPARLGLVKTESLTEETIVAEIEETPAEIEEPAVEAAPVAGPEAGIASVINNLIQDAFRAVDNYNSAIVTINDLGLTNVSTILADIVADENINIGRLQEALQLVDVNAANIEIGKQEAQSQIETPIETVEEDPEEGMHY